MIELTINPEKCINCGVCAEECSFHFPVKGKKYVDHNYNSKKCKKLLQIPNSNKIHAVVILGYPKRTHERIAPRNNDDVKYI